MPTVACRSLNAQFVVVRQLSHGDSQQLTMLVNNNKLITVILKIIQLSVYKYRTLNVVKNDVISVQLHGALHFHPLLRTQT